jgi:hypothetical protein
LFGPFIKKEVFTPSLSTASSLYGGTPNNFSKRRFDSSRFFTAIPMCSIFRIFKNMIERLSPTKIKNFAIQKIVFLYNGNEQTKEDGGTIAK